MYAHACVHFHTQYIKGNYLHVHPRHSTRHIIEKYWCALGFLYLNLTFPKETRTVVCKALFGPGFQIVRRSDRRSYERCEGAGKSAVSCAYHCGHWYSKSYCRVAEVGSRLFRAAGNAETGISYPFLLTL